MTHVGIFDVTGNADQVALVRQTLRGVEESFPWTLAAQRLKKRFRLDAIPVFWEQIPDQGFPFHPLGQVQWQMSTDFFRVRLNPSLVSRDPLQAHGLIAHELIGHAVTDALLLSNAMRTAIMALMPGHQTEWEGQADYAKRPMEGWAETATALHTIFPKAFPGLTELDLPRGALPALRAIIGVNGSPYAPPATPTVPDPVVAEPPPLPPPPVPAPEPDPLVVLQAALDAARADATSAHATVGEYSRALTQLADIIAGVVPAASAIREAAAALVLKLTSAPAVPPEPQP